MSYELGEKAKLIYSGIVGYNRWMKTVIDINQFDTNEVARYRLKVINHYQQFGLASTLSAYPVSRSTLFLWKQKLTGSNGKLSSLIPRSTRPINSRRMTVNPLILAELKRLRQKHYRLGKYKLKPLLTSFCNAHKLPAPSASLIGKIVKHFNLFYQRPNSGYHDPNRKLYKRKVKKIRVLKAPKPTMSGYIQGDTVETITADGLRRYTISFIDVKLKISHSKTYTGKLSKYAKDCFIEFEELTRLAGITIHTVQTDNGSEFEKDFDNYLQSENIKHVWIYPESPKINGCIERYNRSIQEEWMLSYLDEIADPKQFNIRLQEYLYFYHNQRVHESLGFKTPAQIIGKELISPKGV